MEFEKKKTKMKKDVHLKGVQNLN